MTQRGRPPHDDVLTPAEWRVAEFVRHGLTNPAIAARMGTSDEVAFACRFLASNAAAYITGQTLHVNGGMYMP